MNSVFTAPPTGRADGGYAWPEILRNGTGKTVYNFASSGATCTNDIFNRQLSLSNGSVIPNPDVISQIERYQYRVHDKYDPSKTVAMIFIGVSAMLRYRIFSAAVAQADSPWVMLD